jgi:hypothetical protein
MRAWVGVPLAGPFGVPVASMTNASLPRSDGALPGVTTGTFLPLPEVLS